MPRLLPEPLQALPEFSSLCISGPYPASSPIHLCISQARHGGRVLLVTKSKESFLRQLGAFNDAWLNANIGLGRYVEKVSNIDIIYCPTVAQWLSFFTLLHISTDTGLDLSSGALRSIPSMIVLHEPSSLLLPAGAPTRRPTFSTYLLMVTRALSASTALSSPSQMVKVALFDCNLESLRLPVVKPHPSVFGSDDADDDVRKQEPVLFGVLKYFQWHGECGIDVSGDESNAHPTKHRLSLTKAGISLSPSKPIIIKWTEELVNRDEPWLDKPEIQLSCL